MAVNDNGDSATEGERIDEGKGIGDDTRRKESKVTKRNKKQKENGCVKEAVRDERGDEKDTEVDDMIPKKNKVIEQNYKFKSRCSMMNRNDMKIKGKEDVLKEYENSKKVNNIDTSKSDCEFNNTMVDKTESKVHKKDYSELFGIKDGQRSFTTCSEKSSQVNFLVGNYKQNLEMNGEIKCNTERNDNDLKDMRSLGIDREPKRRKAEYNLTEKMEKVLQEQQRSRANSIPSLALSQIHSAAHQEAKIVNPNNSDLDNFADVDSSVPGRSAVGIPESGPSALSGVSLCAASRALRGVGKDVVVESKERVWTGFVFSSLVEVYLDMR